jgi:hypothetical protein
MVFPEKFVFAPLLLIFLLVEPGFSVVSYRLSSPRSSSSRYYFSSSCWRSESLLLFDIDVIVLLECCLFALLLFIFSWKSETLVLFHIDRLPRGDPLHAITFHLPPGGSRFYILLSLASSPKSSSSRYYFSSSSWRSEALVLFEIDYLPEIFLFEPLLFIFLLEERDFSVV